MFTAIDVDGLNVLSSGSDITFVNPHCKKENPPKQSKDSTVTSQFDSAPVQLIGLNGYCTSQFQFEVFSWETDISESFAVFNEYFSSRLSYRYLDNASPPPRLV
jgi:hypothetical protein